MTSADDYLKQKHLFQLGDLPTETPHPRTTELSEWAQGDLAQAISVLREIDLAAVTKIAGMKEELRPVFDAVASTLDAGRRVFLVGCGATGRLSLSLEFLWRRRHPDSDQVRSLMAGGDVALVHSLEGFEDFPEYGARHLRQLGFSRDDLLIGSTEGGETPYVIGAVEEAARSSTRQPLFLYCNTRRILLDKVERSRRVLTNPSVRSFCLDCGPMGLTGSTRMQASTVLMLVIGLALEFGRDADAAFAALGDWSRYLEELPVENLKPFIESEAATYLDGDYTLYSVGDLAITAFTDTTERAPTFNLAPFDNPRQLTDRHALTYITIPSARDAGEAWGRLLARPPRPLDWPEVHAKTSQEYLLSFDFGRGAAEFRRGLLSSRRHHVFAIDSTPALLSWDFRGLTAGFPLPGRGELFDHLTLKLLMNIHSTLVMGRLRRFEGNLMTWLFPSNGKLVDRAARYTQILLRRRGYEDRFSYDDIVRAQFACKASLKPTESIVHRTIDLLLGQETAPRPQP
jgi:N-acetylmuramic acid 6-phosphate etherase